MLGLVFLSRLCKFFLPALFFFKMRKKTFKIKFINKFYFKSFFSHFKKLYSEFFYLHFFRCKLRGLGYRVRYVTKKFIRIFFGTTNYFYLHLPYSIYAKVRRRKILVFSFIKSDLKIFSLFLLSLKKIIPYRLRGFFFPNQIILMKPGKKRF